ncbi:cytochrome-c oxidase, cbb3-type subunit III [Aminobacter sp. NyZ550]|uniref:cytochrome-c oxidase, cbb3-type subunit III n=1 Tax=unclassified Aminobacter TaxID=2644704 RepID=UPI0021D57DD7|nr:MULTISPECIES: cytochrome-c oxidase, cbb3-type subunit III [unclassified Aminobacter]WAX96017.1 cytochrome-c oxidase, cbb3-type subunit III [Aminobacter sp. NyZ550]BBD40532.1 cytochrome c oxidase, cbb3-type subunit III [Aminobacter sp. SS-2016]
MGDKHIDELSGVETTGHEWDGITELNNPMPRWWLWTFYATVVWALAYTIAYPAWPMISSATTGVLGYSSRADVKNELAAAEQAKSAYVQAVKAKSVGEILADDKLRQFATAAGSAAFKVNCIQCHASGAQGSPGFPNLNDDEWLWGGSIDQIYKTIGHGVRFDGDENTHASEMPAFADILEPKQITEVAAYVASLSGTADTPELVPGGAKVFADNCAACHGDNAKGNKELGAPDLSDAIALYASGQAAIASQVRHPKHGVMPAWSARLGDVNVKELAIFVHSLGGGE